MSLDANNVPYAVLLPLPKEVVGAHGVFADSLDPTVGNVRGYDISLCEIPSIVRGAPASTIAIAQPTKVGNVHSAIMVARLSELLPRLRGIIVCGIAGGIPTENDPQREVYLGDIVFGESVLHYDFGHDRRRVDANSLAASHTRDSYTFVTKDPAAQPDDLFLRNANKLEVMDMKGERPWLRRLEERASVLSKFSTLYERPSEGDGLPFDAIENGQVVSRLRKSERNYPRVFRGGIGSANCVLKNPFRREDLRTGQHPVIAIEMEAAGVAIACASLDLKFAVVRGICDYCDNNKKDRWQHYAAAVAAAYTYCLLQHLPIAQPHIRGAGTSLADDTSELERVEQGSVAQNAASSLRSGDLSLPRFEASPPTVTSESQIREWLSSMKVADGRHDTTSFIELARQLEESLTKVSAGIDQKLIALALQYVARGYLLYASDADNETERKRRHDHAQSVVRRAEELLK